MKRITFFFLLVLWCASYIPGYANSYGCHPTDKRLKTFEEIIKRPDKAEEFSIYLLPLDKITKDSNVTKFTFENSGNLEYTIDGNGRIKDLHYVQIINDTKVIDDDFQKIYTLCILMLTLCDSESTRDNEAIVRELIINNDATKITQIDGLSLQFYYGKVDKINSIKQDEKYALYFSVKEN